MSNIEKEQDMAMQEPTVSTEQEHHTSSEHHHHSHHHSHHHHSHHSHHHHSHHHRSSRKSSKNKRSKKEFKQFLHKNRKQLIVFGAALLFCFCSVLAGAFMDSIIHWEDIHNVGSGPIQETREDMLNIGVSAFAQPVSLTNQAVKAHLEAPAQSDVHDVYKQYNGSEVRLDTGLPVKLEYTVSNAPEGYEVDTAVFAVSENKDMSSLMRLAVPRGQESVEVINLKTGTTYYYQLTIAFTNGYESVVQGSFATAAGPRFMTVEGAYNMRDVGGWTVIDGRRIKQGLLYRGSELDGAVEPRYTLTEVGKSVMLTQLNIKTDMDLRRKEETPGAMDTLGANVKHTFYGVPMYSVALNAEHSETMRRVFADLADPAQYPAYLHCTYGLDRTGTVCYLLGALLGMDQTDLIKEYELSAMSQGYVATEEMLAFVRQFNTLPGITLQEKAEQYMLSIGVTPAQIQSIRDIFLEDVQ